MPAASQRQKQRDDHPPGQPLFSNLLSCPHSRARTRLFVRSWGGCCRRGVRGAGDRTRRRRLNKLSCAGWIPHDRGFVSGLTHSSERASVRGPAHNRSGGFPTVALSPAVRTKIGLVVDLLRPFRFACRSGERRLSDAGDRPDKADHFARDGRGDHDLRFAGSGQTAISRA
jgi:hypothetical protein